MPLPHIIIVIGTGVEFALAGVIGITHGDCFPLYAGNSPASVSMGLDGRTGAKQ